MPGWSCRSVQCPWQPLWTGVRSTLGWYWVDSSGVTVWLRSWEDMPVTSKQVSSLCSNVFKYIYYDSVPPLHYISQGNIKQCTVYIYLTALVTIQSNIFAEKTWKCFCWWCKDSLVKTSLQALVNCDNKFSLFAEYSWTLNHLVEKKSWLTEKRDIEI